MSTKPDYTIWAAVSEKTKTALITIGETIRDARIESNETQERLAARLGVSLPTLRKIETGDPSVNVGCWLEALQLSNQLEKIERAVSQEPSLFEQYEKQSTKKRKRAKKTKKAIG